MAFERIAEAIIREAMERGEFQGLEGEGKRIDLQTYFQMPAGRRVVAALLETAGIAPREVQLLQEIWELREQEATAENEAAKRELRKRIAQRQLELDLRAEGQGRLASSVRPGRRSGSSTRQR